MESHLSKERTSIKIKENQMALRKHLAELPSDQTLVFATTNKKLNKKVGTSEFSTKYRGVCKNGAKYQVGPGIRVDVHYGGRAAEDVHRRDRPGVCGWSDLRPGGDPAEGAKGRERVTLRRRLTFLTRRVR